MIDKPDRELADCEVVGRLDLRVEKNLTESLAAMDYGSQYRVASSDERRKFLDDTVDEFGVVVDC